jgi:hypothetical protein
MERLVAVISTGYAVIAASAGTLLAGGVGILLLKPQRQSLIAQASEHATAAIAEAFTRLELELKESRLEVTASRLEVERLLSREGELLRRIDALEEDGRREVERLRHRETELLEQVSRLEAELAHRSE